MKKILIFGIALLFIGMSVIPSTGITIEKKSLKRNISYLPRLQIRIYREILYPFFAIIFIKNEGNETFYPKDNTTVNIEVIAPKMLLGKNTTRTWKPEWSLEPNVSVFFHSQLVFGYGSGVIEVVVKSNDSIIAREHSIAHVFLCFVYTQWCNYTCNRYNYRCGGKP